MPTFFYKNVTKDKKGTIPYPQVKYRTSLIRFSSSCNIKCVGCKINKNLIGFSLNHITPYNIIKANI